jgi:uncharacterized BrkB/YihY/UPF0761 family membrane protein
LPGALLAGVLMEIVTLALSAVRQTRSRLQHLRRRLRALLPSRHWLFFICQFILLGAVLNRMLIGEPETGGAVASPGEAREETRGARRGASQGLADFVRDTGRDRDGLSST